MADLWIVGRDVDPDEYVVHEVGMRGCIFDGFSAWTTYPCACPYGGRVHPRPQTSPRRLCGSDHCPRLTTCSYARRRSRFHRVTL
jgi:hypothetical protein